MVFVKTMFMPCLELSQTQCKSLLQMIEQDFLFSILWSENTNEKRGKYANLC